MSAITESVEAYAAGQITWDELTSIIRDFPYVKPKKMTEYDDDFEMTEGSVHEITSAWDRQPHLSSTKLLDLLDVVRNRHTVGKTTTGRDDRTNDVAASPPDSTSTGDPWTDVGVVNPQSPGLASKLPRISMGEARRRLEAIPEHPQPIDPEQ